MPSLLSMQVSLYLDKFSGVCQPVLHECKLTFLQIICDHDLFVEMPGRDPSDRYFIDSVYLITYVLCCHTAQIFTTPVPKYRTPLNKSHE
jgi:hypothetical protein